MKFLVIVQDLRVSGTSEGIVSRSFISYLRKTFPKSTIDVLYLRCHNGEDDLKLLPVNSLITYEISRKIPFFTRMLNKVYWRLFHYSLKDDHIQKQFKKKIQNKESESYNHIFVRSSGQEYETVLGLYGLKHLKKAIINFHDPYPVFWDTGSNMSLTNLELFRLKKMKEIVDTAGVCISPSQHLSKDLELLYGSNKKFYTLPHIFDIDVFNLNEITKLREKKVKVTITYHGSLQLGRDIDIVLDSYIYIINNNDFLKKNSEFVLRLKSNQYNRLKEKYKSIANIKILSAVSFLESLYEQKHQSDIIIILENKFDYSNILPGKVAVIAGINKRFLSVSPKDSEMRRLLEGTNYIAHSTNKDSIISKLEKLLSDVQDDKTFYSPIADYFCLNSFKLTINAFLNDE
ncbi:MAG: hypothetical protein KBT58_11275 [Bizionia sp.]|nr:hypothetical protein [Bizionia sp.]